MPWTRSCCWSQLISLRALFLIDAGSVLFQVLAKRSRLGARVKISNKRRTTLILDDRRLLELNRIAATRSETLSSVVDQFLADGIRRASSPNKTTWPILYEFLRVSTHRRVFPKPLKAEDARAFIDGLASRDEVAILTSTGRHMEVLASVIKALNHPSGNLLHDVHTAVLMREHGVREIVTADTDFLQFSFLKVNNPLLDPLN